MARIKLDNANERELFHAKESWVPVILGVIPVALVCALISVVVTYFADSGLAVICVLASIVVCVLSRIPHIIDNWRTDVVVSNRRLYYRSGILDIKDHVTDLGSITDVTVDPTIMGRLFNYADVRIQTKAGDDDFVLKEIRDAYEMRRIINVGRDALGQVSTQPVSRPRRGR